MCKSESSRGDVTRRDETRQDVRSGAVWRVRCEDVAQPLPTSAESTVA